MAKVQKKLKKRKLVSLSTGKNIKWVYFIVQSLVLLVLSLKFPPYPPRAGFVITRALKKM